MKKSYWTETVPTAYIAVNKSRLKLYNKDGDIPTFYLSKQTEFQIEVFNPTSNVILAKIHLNGKAISQGGLVLNPGQRVFLDRYFDVAQKFLFDTYEVANTDEVKKAIENNGDLKVEFYKEQQFVTALNWIQSDLTYRPWVTHHTSSPIIGNTTTTTGLNLTSTNSNSSFFCNGNISNTSYDSKISFSDNLDSIRNTLGSKKSKSIETGRVEKGSHSSQEFKTVSKSFEPLPFHTVEYKLLPASQKINTVDDVNVKRYCTNCGHKLGKTDKFCGQCGTKA
jgi:hypothetical protein